MAQMVLDDMLPAIPPQPPTASRNYLPIKLCIEVPKSKFPSIKKKKAQRNTEFGVRGQPAIGSATGED